MWKQTGVNVFLRFCIVSSNELAVLDSLENSKQYNKAGKRFRVYAQMRCNCNAAQIIIARQVAWKIAPCNRSLSPHLLFIEPKLRQTNRNWPFQEYIIKSDKHTDVICVLRCWHGSKSLVHKLHGGWNGKAGLFIW